MNCLCIKDWYMNGKLIFKEEWEYPVLEKHFNGDMKIIGYKIQVEDEFGIWFWSGSDYFDIPHIE
jgi:hypothetical protein